MGLMRMRFDVEKMAPALVLLCALVCVGGALGCGRANPRIDTVTRTQGGQTVVSTLAYDKDGRVANVRRVEGNPDEAPADFTDYTWVDGKLTQIERTITFNDFARIATTELAYEGDLVVSATTTTVIAIPDQEEPRPESEEIVTVEYDDQLFEGLTRQFEDEDRNKADTTVVFTYDPVALGLIEVREDTKLVNNGAPDQEISRVTTIEYAAGKPSRLSLVENEGRATTFDIEYKGGAIKQIALAIPGLDEFNNELIAEGVHTYRFDADERLATVELESDLAETVSYEIDYTNEEGESNGLDLMPAGAVQVPLWDLRGNAYDGIDARTQVPRFLGAQW